MNTQFTVTEEERQKIWKAYFKDGIEGELETFPRKEKRKFIILQAIVQRFASGKTYSEMEVNEVLKSIYDDFATIRRYLIDYGFLERSKDGAAYWVKQKMNHEMGLYDGPFQSIKSGRKTVEVRLFDEKRRKLKIGDTIIFTKIPGGETLTVEIIEITVYPSFRKMYENIPAADFDASDSSIDEMVENTYEIYTPENEKKWGTVAIRIKLLGE